MNPRRWATRLPWISLRGVVVLVYCFILGPIVITATVSFNSTNRSIFPPQGLSLHWWGEALDAKWTSPILFSIGLAGTTALLAIAIGIPVAFALVRREFCGKRALELLTIGPLIMPALVTGIGLLQFLQFSGFGRLLGFPALLIGHLVVCIPFAVRMVAIGLRTMPASIEAAAASLGAPPPRVLREITFPAISGGVFAGLGFAFIHSLSDVDLSLFLGVPGQRPVTIVILGFLEYGFAPTLAAVSIITLLIPLVLIALLERFVSIGNFLYDVRATR
jgi:putative spermidine/putrescine transport system permease protein